MGHLTGSPKRLETGHIWLEIFGKSSYIYIYIYIAYKRTDHQGIHQQNNEELSWYINHSQPN